MITLRQNDTLEFDKLFTEYGNKSPYEVAYDYYRISLLEKCVNMFKYTNMPNTMDIRFYELVLMLQGTVGILKHDDYGICAVRGGYTGDIGIYDIPDSYQYVNVKFSGTGKVGESILVGHNTLIITSIQRLLHKYADLLAQADVSLSVGMENTRLLNIFACMTDADREQINEVIKSNKSGESFAYTSKTHLFEDTHMFDLRGNKNVNELPSLLQVRDDLVAQFCCEIGISLNNKTKKAQVISKELNGYENYSEITVLDMLTERRKLWDSVNEKFGTTVKVELNDWIDTSANDGATDGATEGAHEGATEGAHEGATDGAKKGGNDDV